MATLWFNFICISTNYITPICFLFFGEILENLLELLPFLNYSPQTLKTHNLPP
jgi:hypothetical protein